MAGDDKKTLGLQSDGSVVVDRDNDFAFQFLRSLNWNRPLEHPTSSATWMCPMQIEQTSMAFKHLNHELADGYIDPDNPCNKIVVPHLREEEKRSKKKKGAKNPDGEFSVIKQNVHEVGPSTQNPTAKTDASKFFASTILGEVK